MTRVREWLTSVPTADPFERRSAATMQVFCVGLTALLVVNEGIRFLGGRGAESAADLYGVFADFATIAASLGCIFLIRRGRVRRGFVLVIGSYVAILAGSLVLRGLAYHEHILVRVYWVVLVLPALLLGRRALWTSLGIVLASMLVGHLRDEGALGGPGPLSTPEPALGVWGQAVAVLLLLCVVLDRFGAALRDAYSATVARTREAEQASQALLTSNRSLAEEMERRLNAETMLFQSQKLEAIGRMSGGAAHDFNNVLTAIMGFAELGKLSLGPDDPLRSDLTQIVEAAERAAGLTRQMLAFARRQIVEPRTLTVENRVMLLGPMLRRVIGENVRIEERFVPDPWTIRIDPIQLDQVLVNLAVNARDAMPEGGTLTIETSHAVVEREDRVAALGLEPGEHVRLSISDTGAGMDATTLESIFEPFFTTKDKGKGTGLGLATCYGIVRQAGGAITVRSSPGHGATFDILLPRGGTSESVEQREPRASVPAEGRETVLVVEDDPRLLEIAERALRSSGFRVLVAREPEAAMALASEHPGDIALLLTDVVMPGTDGRRLASELRRIRPTLTVLYMSGHSDDVVARHGVLEPGIELLAKPFTPDALVDKVRGVLEARRQGTAAGAS